MDIAIAAGMLVTSFYLLRKRGKTKVLSFPDDNLCPLYCSRSLMNFKTGCSNPYCKYTHRLSYGRKSSLIEILSFLNSAEKTIDIYTYHMTDPYFNQILGCLTRKSISIRIVTSDDILKQTKHYKNQVQAFLNAGVDIRAETKDPFGLGTLMHDKFIVVDNKKFLLGSFGWKANGILPKNKETIIITSKIKTVKKFIREFKRLWTEAYAINIQMLEGGTAKRVLQSVSDDCAIR